MLWSVTSRRLGSLNWHLSTNDHQGPSCFLRVFRHTNSFPCYLNSSSFHQNRFPLLCPNTIIKTQNHGLTLGLYQIHLIWGEDQCHSAGVELCLKWNQATEELSWKHFWSVVEPWLPKVELAVPQFNYWKALLEKVDLRGKMPPKIDLYRKSQLKNNNSKVEQNWLVLSAQIWSNNIKAVFGTLTM